MRIKYENIILIVLIITLIVLLIRLPPLLRSLSEDFGTLYGADGDPAIGIMALGLICITAVAIAKVLSNRK